MLRTLSPTQTLVLGFLLIVLTGAVLLSLPVSSADGRSQPFLDALFVATSSVSTTGLTPVDTGSFYSLFGQLVILLLIKVGGLGYMVFFVLAAYVVGSKTSFYTRMTFQESMAGVSPKRIKRIAVAVIVFTASFEGVGAAFLTTHWAQTFPLGRAIYLGVFHAVSGFCTAGFGLFPDSLTSCAGNALVNLVVNVICFAGAIGFFVLYDLSRVAARPGRSAFSHRLSVHSRLALLTSALLMTVGTAVIFLFEQRISQLPIERRLLAALFQSISASTTTGYNTIAIGGLGSTTLLVLIVLMFVGASPGSTGGGIKTTTLGVMLASLGRLLRGKEELNLFHRRIRPQIVDKAFVIGLMSFLLVVLDALILAGTERAPFLDILFEIVSGFGNVGLSTGLTPKLSLVGKWVITLTMFIGRVGPLAVGFALAGRVRRESFRYPAADVFVG